MPCKLWHTRIKSHALGTQTRTDRAVHKVTLTKLHVSTQLRTEPQSHETTTVTMNDQTHLEQHCHRACPAACSRLALTSMGVRCRLIRLLLLFVPLLSLVQQHQGQVCGVEPPGSAAAAPQWPPNSLNKGGGQQ